AGVLTPAGLPSRLRRYARLGATICGADAQTAVLLRNGHPAPSSVASRWLARRSILAAKAAEGQEAGGRSRPPPGVWKVPAALTFARAALLLEALSALLDDLPGILGGEPLAHVGLHALQLLVCAEEGRDLAWPVLGQVPKVIDAVEAWIVDGH